MVELKTRSEIAAMREAGRVVAQALAAVRAHAAVGVTLLELDEVARSVLRSAGATSPFLNYQPHFAMTPVPRRDLHLGQLRRPARDPVLVPARVR